MKIKKYYISCSNSTGQVNTNEIGTIISAPPIWRIFIDSSMYGLIRWLEGKFGKVEVEEL
jgi:hypothetical protein